MSCNNLLTHSKGESILSMGKCAFGTISMTDQHSNSSADHCNFLVSSWGSMLSGNNKDTSSDNGLSFYVGRQSEAKNCKVLRFSWFRSSVFDNSPDAVLLKLPLTISNCMTFCGELSLIAISNNNWIT